MPRSRLPSLAAARWRRLTLIEVMVILAVIAMLIIVCRTDGLAGYPE